MKFRVVLAFAILIALHLWVGSAHAFDQKLWESCEDDARGWKQKFDSCNSLIVQEELSDEMKSKIFAERGRANDSLKNNDEALADLTQAIILDKKNIFAYFYRAQYFQERDRHLLAVRDYTAVIQLRPKHASAYAARGQSNWYRKDFDEALKDFDQAILLRPDFAFAYANRAGLKKDMHDLQGAESDFEKAVEHGSFDETVFNNRCNFFRELKKYEEAMRDCNRSLEINPQNHYALDSRGDLWMATGNIDAAIIDYEKALQINPLQMVSISNLSTAFERKGDLKKAIEYLDQYLKQNSGDSVVVERLAQLRGSFATQGLSSAPISSLTNPNLNSQKSQLKKVALIIGNETYRDAAALKNPVNDSLLVSEALKEVGFIVETKTNLTRDHFLSALLQFRRVADDADWSVLYFSGHGIELNGINYLVPIDAQLRSDRDVSLEAIDLNQVSNAISGSRKLRLIVLDACRDNPFASNMRRTFATRSISQGLGRVEPDAGTLIAFAAKHGETALDGASKYSPFTGAFVSRVRQTPPIEIRRLFDFIRDDVIAVTNKRQQPFTYGSVSAQDEFFFR
jgi:tetratricopeptide (TPR) repeat protein